MSSGLQPLLPNPSRSQDQRTPLRQDIFDEVSVLCDGCVISRQSGSLFYFLSTPLRALIPLHDAVRRELSRFIARVLICRIDAITEWYSGTTVALKPLGKFAYVSTSHPSIRLPCGSETCFPVLTTSLGRWDKPKSSLTSTPRQSSDFGSCFFDFTSGHSSCDIGSAVLSQLPIVRALHEQCRKGMKGLHTTAKEAGAKGVNGG